MVSFISVSGHESERPDDPMIIAQGVAGGSLISHSLHRETCEDLQAYAFLTQRAFTQRAVGSVWVETNKDDPPDRYLRWENERLGLELTELTLGPVRAAEADARRMRSALLAAVEQRPEWYAHLVGRHVVMWLSASDWGARTPPPRSGPVASPGELLRMVAEQGKEPQ